MRNRFGEEAQKRVEEFRRLLPEVEYVATPVAFGGSYVRFYGDADVKWFLLLIPYALLQVARPVLWAVSALRKA